MKLRYPKVMPDLKEEDFVYGTWAVPASDEDETKLINKLRTNYADELSPKELRRAECNTRCCLVGHVRHAFGLPAEPERGDLPPAGVDFLVRFCENVGRPIDYDPEWDDAYAVQSRASDVFEGGEYDHDGKIQRSLQPSEAVAGWQKTLRDLKYTVPCKY